MTPPPAPEPPPSTSGRPDLPRGRPARVPHALVATAAPQLRSAPRRTCPVDIGGLPSSSAAPAARCGGLQPSSSDGGDEGGEGRPMHLTCATVNSRAETVGTRSSRACPVRKSLGVRENWTGPYVAAGVLRLSSFPLRPPTPSEERALDLESARSCWAEVVRPGRNLGRRLARRHPGENRKTRLKEPSKN